jgi:replicative DNA helicase
MDKANYLAGADALCVWRDGLLSGCKPTLWPIAPPGCPMGNIEVGPGRVVLVGGPPGAGKTALCLQWVADALRLSPDLRVALANVEMGPAALLDRMLARTAGVSATAIRKRELSPDEARRVADGLDALEPLLERLTFVRQPFSLDNIAATADAVDAGVIVADYIQRIAVPGRPDDSRASMGCLMDFVRQFADAGCGIVALSAVGRGKDSRGRSSYAGDALSLASFRESSELEFGADDAFILSPDDEDAGIVILRHLKSRNGETHDVRLRFNKPLMRFDADEPTRPAASKGKLAAAIARLWQEASPADDTDDEGAGDGL